MIADNISLMHEALQLNFLQFRQKQNLIEYYVSFQFPDKQKKMVAWWQKIIDFTIMKSGKVYLTYQELQQYFTIYGLKPTPLNNILNYLKQSGSLCEQRQMENKIRDGQEINKENSWITNTLKYFWKKPQKKQTNSFKFTPNLKIFSKKLKENAKIKIISAVNLLCEHNPAIGEAKLCDHLRKSLNLDTSSLNQLLGELKIEHKIQILQMNQDKIVLYSIKQSNIQNSDWCKMEGMKYKLKLQADKFQSVIDTDTKRRYVLMESAKREAEQKNDAGARRILHNVKAIDKKIENIHTRKVLIQNQLNNLELNEMSLSSIELVEQAQKIYQQSMIDPAKLQEISERNMQIQINQKQANIALQKIVSEDDESVDQLMKELQTEVKSNKIKAQKQQIMKRVIKPLPNEKQVEQKSMDIEML